MRTPLLLLSVLCAPLLVCAQYGPQQSFHANGRIESTRYTEGGMERFINYYESGRVKEMGGFRNGRKHGTWKQFDESGTVVAEAHFVKGRREGVWLFRDGGAGVRGRLHYAEGRLTEGSQYEAGELVAHRSYP